MSQMNMPDELVMKHSFLAENLAEIQ